MTDQNVRHIEDVIHEYNIKAKELMIHAANGVLWLTEQNGELVPHVPDNVLIFPTNRSMN